jgi:hypothetical protein
MREEEEEGEVTQEKMWWVVQIFMALSNERRLISLRHNIYIWLVSKSQ